jgi:hypothetical protein
MLILVSPIFESNAKESEMTATPARIRELFLNPRPNYPCRGGGGGGDDG